MLEKIGLPPKPSLRGNNWVVDASNCQGCSSQFTFINRKHHCRRCGGIFCGSCTQQRMFLRGQGDSPVRICEPCKKLEEAARLEMRYGHKNRAAKGGSKLASKNEDQLLDSSSCSSIQHRATPVEGSDIVRSLSLDQPTDTLAELDSSTPEDLRQQAVVEKAKYKTLKAEGKSEEALRAFKRGKELERQAAALAISLRKNRGKALSSSSSMSDIQQKEDLKPSSGRNKEKDDISAELKELGWSDVDIRESDKKPASLTLEGELSSLIREVSQKPNNKEKQVVSSDKSQVIAHKKRALELKRAGNLIEAKEELKRAKILERKIEEEELLGGADDDSDDELSALIRSMDGDDDDDLSSTYKKSDIDFNINHSDDFGVDGSLEVTDEDLEDPEMAFALKSLGWTEEDIADSEDLHVSVSSSSKKEFKKESLATEIQSLKREALNQKRAGNTAEAMALLKKAKTLEMELDNSDDSRGSKEETLIHMRENVDVGPKMAPKNKLAIQRELIALKKKALALRREGRVDESEEELKKAKVLEEQLEDMNKAPTVSQSSIGNKAPGNEDDEEVTDQDLHDPSYLSLLKNMGWEDEDNSEVKSSMLKENNSVSSSTSISFNTQPVSNVEDVKSRKSKSEIQRELLALKRKALALRRQGDTEAVDEVLKNATSLEEQLQEYEEPKQREVSSENDAGNANVNAKSSLHEKDKVVRDEKPEERVNKNENLQIQESNPSQEILAHKRKALALKREGKLAEAKEELRLAKLLEKHAEEDATKSASSNSGNITSTSDSPSTKKPDSSPGSVSKPLSSRDRFKMQQESLGHKRQALKLRREGKTAEADAEFELAKALEAQLQELDSHESKSSEPDGVSVEDFLDPQLLSALQSIGLEHVQTTSTSQPESVKSSADDDNDSNIEKEQLIQRIKAEKVKAVNLKRSGKQAEALDALRRAKLYEKKLESLSS